MFPTKGRANGPGISSIYFHNRLFIRHHFKNIQPRVATNIVRKICSVTISDPHESHVPAEQLQMNILPMIKLFYLTNCLLSNHIDEKNCPSTHCFTDIKLLNGLAKSFLPIFIKKYELPEKSKYTRKHLILIEKYTFFQRLFCKLTGIAYVTLSVYLMFASKIFLVFPYY